jgi:hypothetical protein
MWLGIVLKMKACGVRSELAAQIAAFAERVRGLTRHLNWEGSFSPFEDAFDAKFQWFIEIGDMQLVRFVTDACPSKVGLYATAWTSMKTRRLVEDASPIVSLRLDLSALARKLQAL